MTRTDRVCALIAFTLTFAALVIVLSACRPVEPMVTRPPGWSVCDEPGAVTDRGPCP